MRYDPAKIEKKWREKWENSNIYWADFPSKKKKFYTLVEFPYPSGEGLHVGHVKGQTAVDIFARFKRMQGYNVLSPMGWDAFGLPAENFAIKNKKHPAGFTQKNINNFRRQVKSFYPSFDWSREINTTDSKYYKWTQWIFLQLFKKGLAYEKEAAINWCPKDKTGLANEEVINGRCERCDTPVEKKMMRQWFLKITAYADRLIKDLDGLDWPDYIKTSQKNWIGKSEGAEIEFRIQNSEFRIKVFTTRPDTLFGATYMVLAPEHELISKIKNQILNIKEVEAYIKAAGKKSEIERTAETKEKTGVELKGIKAVNPATKEKIPVWISDYVLASYGTGAIMAVPAHDERDWEFVQYVIVPETREPGDKFIRSVVKPNSYKELMPYLDFISDGQSEEEEAMKSLRLLLQNKFCYPGYGVSVNSGKFSGLDSNKAKWEVTKFVGGKRMAQYRLRDWLFSRQRYWGEPIPIIKCPKCGNVPVPEKDLPILLPNVKKYEPSGTGESPLANIKSWVNVRCPRCKGPAKRETNTMPQWAGSSWYFMRYTDPKNPRVLADKKKLKYFMPVDIYFGGAEHTTVHLLYSRFWNKALYDMGHVPYSEPYRRRVQHGLILGADNRKMSKRWGNVINPDDVVRGFGADTMRTYIMFMGPYGESIAWSTSSIEGIARFMKRVWGLNEKISKKTKPNTETIRLVHQTIKKVTRDIEAVSYHTAIAQLMILLNHFSLLEEIDGPSWKVFLQLLAPFAPFITEELWQKTGQKASIHRSNWPVYDEKLIADTESEVVVQVNGKVRGRIKLPKGASEYEAREAAKREAGMEKYLSGEPKRVIFVPDRLINFVF